MPSLLARSNWLGISLSGDLRSKRVATHQPLTITRHSNSAADRRHLVDSSISATVKINELKSVIDSYLYILFGLRLHVAQAMFSYRHVPEIRPGTFDYCPYVKLLYLYQESPPPILPECGCTTSRMDPNSS